MDGSSEAERSGLERSTVRTRTAVRHLSAADLDSHNECRNDSDCDSVSVAYSADNDDFASDSDLDNDSEMEPTEDATLRSMTVGG